MLETTGLACERGGLRLFSDISFSLTAGGLLRVHGANGSGKTTLLRALAGLTRPASGAVHWKGHPIDDEFRGQMLYLGHAPAVKDELSVMENLQFSARLAELESPDFEKALELLDISHLAERPAGQLSQGQRRRAALARLPLSLETPLWLLDEPFAALDDASIGRVAALCGSHLAAGGMLVLTSHQDVSIAAGAANELVLGK